MDNLITPAFFVFGIVLGAFCCWWLLNKSLQELKLQNARLAEAKEQLSQSYQDSKENEAVLRVEKTHLEQDNVRQTKTQKEQQEQLKLHFKNLANEILEQKTNQFKQDSNVQLTHLLKPFQQKMESFQKEVKDSFKEHGQEQTTLKTYINLLNNSHKQLQEGAQQLTKALKGDSKTQGNWGEVQLAKILEESGLRKDADYKLQPSFSAAGLEGHQQRLQPDAVVYLPENKQVIIDAKVSLTHYERYFSTEDPLQKDQFLKQFSKSINQHIKGLHEKCYQDLPQLQTPDFVLLFIPIEGVFALATQQTHNLFSEAWEKKIVLVSPGTLLACLRIIELTWKIQHQSQNAEKIAKAGGSLYDKLCGFMETFQKIGQSLQKTQQTYNTAVGRLETGKGNAISQAKKLKELGIPTKKELPEILMQTEAEIHIESYEN